jgi:parallel beta-helix repeat protein
MLVANNLVSGNYEGIDVQGSWCAVSSNRVFQNGYSGISFGEGSNNTIVGNLVEQNGVVGIYLFGSSSLISGNQVRATAGDGILVDSSSSGNRIESNRAVGNGTYPPYHGVDMRDNNSPACVNTWRINPPFA